MCIQLKLLDKQLKIYHKMKESFLKKLFNIYLNIYLFIELFSKLNLIVFSTT
jgi:hypothetical protein